MQLNLCSVQQLSCKWKTGDYKRDIFITFEYHLSTTVNISIFFSFICPSRSPQVLKWKATDVILLPLWCVTASPLQFHDPGTKCPILYSTE